MKRSVSLDCWETALAWREADDEGVDGFAFVELGDGLGELRVGEAFEHFESAIQVSVSPMAMPVAAAVVDAEGARSGTSEVGDKVVSDLAGEVFGQWPIDLLRVRFFLLLLQDF